MAIAVDSANNASNSTGSPLTWTHTATGSNLILFVSVAVISATGGTSDKVTAATYNGSNMTLIGKSGTNTGGLNEYIESYLYYVINPATGGATVSISFTTSGGSPTCYGSSVSYTGAAQTGVPDSSSSSNSSGSNVSSITGSTTVVASNCWTIMAAGNYNAGMTAGSGTRRTNQNNSVIIDSNGTVSTGSQSLQAVNNNGNSLMAEVIASFAPVASVNSNFLMFM